MIRFSGGKFRGQAIASPNEKITRPSQSKLRQALFNSVQFECEDARVLDLFSGSGALGFEALSRSAAFVLAVEKNLEAVRVIESNRAKLKISLTEHTLLVHDALSAFELIEKHAPFSLVFLDPPYGEKLEELVLKAYDWKKILNPAAKVIIEWSDRVLTLPDEIGPLKKTREKTYGDSILTTYLFSGDDDGK